MASSELTEDEKINRVLTDEAQRKIQKEVEAQLEVLVPKEVNKKLFVIARLLGITGIGAVIGAGWFAYSSYTNTINAFIEETKITISVELDNQIKSALDENNSAIVNVTENVARVRSDANALSGKLIAYDENIASISNDIANAQGDIASLLSSTNTVDAAAFLRQFEDSEAASVMQQLSVVVSAQDGLFGGCQPRIFVGQTDTENTAWMPFKHSNDTILETALQLTIDTSQSGFGQLAIYFFTLRGGSGVWGLSGTNGIYSQTENNFRLIMKDRQWNTGDNGAISDYAIKNNWYVSWMGIGCAS